WSKPSLTSLEDAGSIPAESDPSPKQGAHPSVGQGIGSSFAAVVSPHHSDNIPVTGMRQPTVHSTVANSMAGSRDREDRHR
uniref:Uncharacterized protein n=1 Tax=Plectus sambesii TaxID=2011161 RepID=A0A914X575_9BILA